MSGIEAKIERAKEHFDEIKQLVLAFGESKPYRVVGQEHSETGEYWHVLRVRRYPPRRIAAVTGDMLHNLRSALDFLAWQLVEANGVEPTDKTSFPISNSPEEFETSGLRKVEGASKGAVELVKAAKPYQGGNDALWRLHKLDIVDKHRLLVTVGSAYTNISIDFSTYMQRTFGRELPPMRLGMKPAESLFPLKDGTVLYRVMPGARRVDDDDPEFSFEIALDEPKVVEGEPLIPTLNDLLQAVEGVIEAFRLLL